MATSLSASQEYRFEVAAGAVVTLRLTSGSAEMFGAELAPQRPYAFTGPTHEAVYTWHGCTFELDGGCQHAYVASETPMDAYLRLHTDLDARRAAARQADTHGPRVIVAGGAGSGKAALCRMLANWAARRGDGPLLVELDPSHGHIGPPGLRTTRRGEPLALAAAHSCSAGPRLSSPQAPSAPRRSGGRWTWSTRRTTSPRSPFGSARPSRGPPPAPPRRHGPLPLALRFSPSASREAAV